MATIYWSNLLHFYQPPIQIPEVLRKIVEESYRPLIEVFNQHPQAKVSVNINGVLTEMLYESGYQDVIDGLRALAERGQVEFVGSAKYHAILPLIDADEQRRQIRRNHLTNKHFFGDAYQPRGFFPPEMCYDRSIIDPILDFGHEWVIMSGVACPAPWAVDKIYTAKSQAGEAIAVIFRDDVLSNKISFQDLDGKGFIEHLRSAHGNDRDMYIVTAMDAETFGHHIENWDQLFLAEAYEAVAPYETVVQAGSLASRTRTLLTMTEPEATERVVTCTVSELFDRFPRAETIEPVPASWSTTHDDIAAGVPYPLWQQPGNYIHKLQWEHVDIALDLVRKAQQVADGAVSQRHAEIARGLMDPALHSCQFWWASRRPHWDINMIARGLGQQGDVVLNAFRAINLSGAPEDVKRDAYYKVVASRDIRAKIRDQLFWD
ncbi:MAG TPA: hypothetical protein VFC53_00350 [Dehalococcoidia bacterium]|nr:hypothetical protein [Dehalococcoidia bacterium]